MNYLNTNERIVSLCNGQYGKRQDYSLFWPYEYIPTIAETTMCNVCFDVQSQQSYTNTTFTNLILYFFIVCHIDTARIPTENGLRYDLIAYEIMKDFAGHSFMGLGNMRLESNNPYEPTREFRGRSLVFTLFDISQETINKHDWTAV